MAWEAPWEAGWVSTRLYLFKTGSSPPADMRKDEDEGSNFAASLADGANASLHVAIANNEIKRRILGCDEMGDEV